MRRRTCMEQNHIPHLTRMKSLPTKMGDLKMKIVIEDYNGNDMCELHINTFTDLCEIDNLINCDIADVDEDDDGNEYLRIQLNN